MKRTMCKKNCKQVIVAPRRGAWIETSMEFVTDPTGEVAPRRGAWIET